MSFYAGKIRQTEEKFRQNAPRDTYERPGIAATDPATEAEAARTNPGSELMVEVFRLAGPSVILLHELVNGWISRLSRTRRAGAAPRPEGSLWADPLP
jgi:hypothetical protein